MDAPLPTPPNPTTDAAQRDGDIVLLLRAGQGGPAFDALVQRYERKVYRLCMALLRDESRAEDAAQDVFLRAWRALANYDDGQAALSTWLYAITRNCCLSLLARQAPECASLSVPEVWAEAEALPMAFEPAADEAPAALLGRLVNALPTAYRACLTLFYYEDKSVSEVARMLGLPEGTVKTHLYRARRLLRAEFQRLGLDELGLWQ